MIHAYFPGLYHLKLQRRQQIGRRRQAFPTLPTYCPEGIEEKKTGVIIKQLEVNVSGTELTAARMSCVENSTKLQTGTLPHNPHWESLPSPTYSLHKPCSQDGDTLLFVPSRISKLVTS